MSGPLTGFRIVEMAGIGPGPFACMLLSDLGAEVIRIERTSGGLSLGGISGDILDRGRKSIAVDLKKPESVEVVLRLIETADALVEGFRPGVMEKLGLGPDLCLEHNPRLVYGRITGWGQYGPLAQSAGHDINYISITGALDSIGRAEGGPVPPLNLVGDFGGGSMYLIMGLLAALLEVGKSGRGQVVDAAVTDGTISLMACMQGLKAMGMWSGPRQSNMLDGGAHYYDTYQCADGRWVSVGSLEPQFYAQLGEKLGVDIGTADLTLQLDPARWPELKQRIAEVFATKSSDEWCQIMEGTDVCFAPVLSMDEAPTHPHNVARRSFVDPGGVVQAAPAPRFSRTPGEIQSPPSVEGKNSRVVLEELGYSAERVEDLLSSGAVVQA